MSDILNSPGGGAHNVHHTSHNNINNINSGGGASGGLSNGLNQAHNSILNQAASQHQQHMQMRNAMLNQPAFGTGQQVVSQYKFASKWQEFADLIYNRMMDGSDISNQDDEEIADSVLTDAMIRDRTIDLMKCAFKTIGVFVLAAVGIITIPLYLKDSFFYMLIFSAFSLSYIYFFQYVFLQARQYVLGVITKKLYLIMARQYEKVKYSILIISVLCISLISVLSTVEPSVIQNIFALKYLQDKILFVGVQFYVFLISFFFVSNYVLLILLETSLYNKFKINANKRRIARHMETATAGTVASNILKGEYEE